MIEFGGEFVYYIFAIIFIFLGLFMTFMPELGVKQKIFQDQINLDEMELYLSLSLLFL